MKTTITKRTTRQVLALERALTPASRAALAALPKPDRVCGVRTPRNLDDLSIGELLGLQADGAEALIGRIAALLLKVPARRCYRERADRMLGFVLWVGREIERIAARFAAAGSPPTPEELRAGIDELDFGPFGIIDWYARRQGFPDQDDAARTAWVRVCECMRIDNRRIAYERRLRGILSEKNR